MNTLELATALVHFVASSQPFSDKQVRMLFDIVKSAGFNPKSVVRGTLEGHYVDQDGSKSGRMYPINGRCPYKVIGKEYNDDDYFATGWLNDIVSLASNITGTRSQLIVEVKGEILRSVPLRPIQIDLAGDMLREKQPSPHELASYKYFVEHTKDTDPLVEDTVGVHMVCSGYIYRRDINHTQSALICRECTLRVPFSKKVATYGQLRKFFIQQLGDGYREDHLLKFRSG